MASRQRACVTLVVMLGSVASIATSTYGYPEERTHQADFTLPELDAAHPAAEMKVIVTRVHGRGGTGKLQVQFGPGYRGRLTGKLTSETDTSATIEETLDFAVGSYLNLYAAPWQGCEAETCVDEYRVRIVLEGARTDTFTPRGFALVTGSWEDEAPADATVNVEVVPVP